jgi:hypothetical protein
MADSIPKPIIFVVATAIESVLITLAVPQYLPAHPLLYVFWRLFALQFTVYSIYVLSIYPRFISPLRHLPGPTTVSSSPTTAQLITSTDERHH